MAWKLSVFGVLLVRMWENTDQKNFEYTHFSRSAKYTFEKNGESFED